LDPAPLEALQRWFSEITEEQLEERVRSTEASAGQKTAVPAVVAFFTSIQWMLKSSTIHRERIVTRIRHQVGDLVGHVNNVLASAHKKIRRDDGARELLLLVDNLDRYEPEVIDKALAQGQPFIQGLNCNLILTPPISVMIQPHTEPLNALYPSELTHTPAVRRPTDPPDALRDPGLDLLTQVLDRRFVRDAVLSPADEVTRKLIRLSGGSLRDLIDLVRESIIQTQSETITPDAVDQAVKKRHVLLKDQVDVSGQIPLLVEVARQHKLGEDAGYLRLIFQRWVLRYNGSDWYDVHPVIRRLSAVSDAIVATSPILPGK